MMVIDSLMISFSMGFPQRILGTSISAGLAVPIGTMGSSTAASGTSAPCGAKNALPKDVAGPSRLAEGSTESHRDIYLVKYGRNISFVFAPTLKDPKAIGYWNDTSRVFPDSCWDISLPEGGPFHRVRVENVRHLPLKEGNPWRRKEMLMTTGYRWTYSNIYNPKKREPKNCVNYMWLTMIDMMICSFWRSVVRGEGSPLSAENTRASSSIKAESWGLPGVWNHQKSS